MERLFNWEQWRIITISTVSPLFGYLTPTKVFVVREYLKKNILSKYAKFNPVRNNPHHKKDRWKSIFISFNTT